MLSDDIQTIGKAIGRIPSGCAILTAQHEGRTTGMLVSWLQQAAFDPPSISVCLKKGRPVMDLVEGSQRFMLNLVGKDPAPMFKHFGRGFAPDEDAFEGLTTEPNDYGPIIVDTIARLGCRVTGRLDAGDHELYVGRVVMANVAADASPYTHIRKSGLTY